MRHAGYANRRTTSARRHHAGSAAMLTGPLAGAAQTGLIVAGVGTVLGGLAGYINAWRAIRSPERGTAGAASQPAPTAAPLSLLLLPLANLTGNPGNAYLADGLTSPLNQKNWWCRRVGLLYFHLSGLGLLLQWRM